MPGEPQERLIALALLLGCDYTEGVPGIGVVNAVEVIMAFLPPEDQPPQKGQGWQVRGCAPMALLCGRAPGKGPSATEWGVLCAALLGSGVQGVGGGAGREDGQGSSSQAEAALCP